MRTVVVVMVLLSGCSQSADSYCTARARAECKKEQRCGRVSKQVDCQDYQARNECLAQLQPAIDDKRVSWDGLAAARCVDAIEHESCDTYTGESDACAVLVVGKHKLGEACGSCEAGLYCTFSESSSCGACQSVPPARSHKSPGEQCLFLSGLMATDCARGSFCSGATGNAVCTARVADGQSCSSGGFTEVCGEASRCADSLCAPKLDVGATCNVGSDDCLGGLWCDTARCAPQRAAGAACTGPTQCLSGLCFNDACTLLRAIGETCDPAIAPCTTGATCANGTCVAQARLGQACDPGVGCFGAICMSGADAGSTCTRSPIDCW